MFLEILNEKEWNVYLQSSRPAVMPQGYNNRIDTFKIMF